MLKSKNKEIISIAILIVIILFAIYFIPKLSFISKGSTTPIYNEKNKNLDIFKLGIDVSEHQGVIDWKAVSKGSVDFAIIRAGYAWNDTNDHTDKYFKQNVDQAKKHNIPIGAYHYSYATTVEEAEKEAAFFLSLVDGIQFDYPLYYDIEDECQDDLSQKELTDIVIAFLEEVKKAGYYVGLYTNPSHIEQLDMERLKEYDLWIANYNVQNIYEGPFGMWQYTCFGKVHGIEGDVDLNYCYYDYPSFIRSLNKNHT